MRFWLFVLLPILLLQAACTKGHEAAPDRQLNVATWSNYISKELLEEFYKKTKIRVNLSYYSSNEELLGKIQAGAEGYDLIVPSDYMVFVMAKLGLLQTLDLSKIPNFEGVDSQMVKRPFDPDNKFSVPFAWGTTGIAVNTSKYKKTVSSWRDLFENPEVSGKFSVMDDAREALGAAAKLKGFSLNTTLESELKLAKEILMKTKKNVKAFNSETLDLLVSGEVVMAQAYSSDALKARAATKGQIDFIIPKEGATLWIDNLAVPAKSKKAAEAQELINFLLEDRVNASRVVNFFTAPVKKGAMALLPAELKSDSRLFLPKEVMARTELMIDLGDKSEIWDRLWTEIKAE